MAVACNEGNTMEEQRQTLEEVAAENLRAYRVLRRLSQADLAAEARKCGAPSLSRQALSEIERGRRGIGIEELAAIAVPLRLTISDLLDPYGPGVTGRYVSLGDHRLSREQAHLWVRDKVVPRLSADRGLLFPSAIGFEPQPAEMPAMAQGALRAISERHEGRRTDEQEGAS
jgi:transcriptional regulator with XRE-family HTH domain